MALYAGLSAKDALEKWYAIRHKPAASLTPEEKNDISGNMTGLAQENPEAWNVVKNGVEDPTDSDYFYQFNQQTGQWDRTEHHGFFSHPESWLQLGFGGALGGVAAAGLGATGSLGGTVGSGSAAGTGGAGAATGATIADPGIGAAGVPNSIAGGAGGAAGTAGSTGSILGTAGKVGSVLGKAGAISKALSPVLGGAAGGANQSQQANDSLQLRLAQLGLEAPQQRLNTSVRASIAANAKPVQITTGPSPFAHAPAGSTMPHFTNSLGPQDISPDTRALAQQIIAQQLQEQMSPNHGLPDVGNGSTAGNILGGAALGSSILGSLGTLRGQGTSSAINIDPGQFNDPGILDNGSLINDTNLGRDFIDPGMQF